MKIKIVMMAQKVMFLSLEWMMVLLFAGAVLDMASYIIPFANNFPLSLAGKFVCYSGAVIVVGALIIRKTGRLNKR